MSKNQEPDDTGPAQSDGAAGWERLSDWVQKMPDGVGAQSLEEYEALQAQHEAYDQEIECRRKLETSPDDPEALAELAHVLIVQDREDEALEYRLRYTQVCPDCATGWMMLGQTYQYVMQDNDALRAFEKSLALDPRCLYVRCTVADIYKERGDYSRAIDLVDAEINSIKDAQPEELADDYGRLWFIKAECYTEQNLDYQAYLAYREGYEYCPCAQSLCAGLAKAIVTDGGDLDEAIYLYRKALSMQGDDIYWNLNYARVLIQKAQETAKTEPEAPESVQAQYNCYSEALQVINHAEKLLFDLVEREGNRMWMPGVYHTKAELFASVGRYAQALECARMAKAVNSIVISRVEHALRTERIPQDDHGMTEEFNQLADIEKYPPTPAALAAHVEELYAPQGRNDDVMLGLAAGHESDAADERPTTAKSQAAQDLESCRDFGRELDDMIRYLQHKAADPDGPDPDMENPWDDEPDDGFDHLVHS